MLLLALVLSSPIAAAASTPKPMDHAHHHAGMTMVADCPSFADPSESDLGDAPCKEPAATLHCASAPCCFQTENGTAKTVALGRLSRPWHRLDDDRVVLSRRTVPLDRPPRRI